MFGNCMCGFLVACHDDDDDDGDDDDDDDDDDDGVYLKAVNINLRANLQILKSVNLKCL